MKKNILYAIAVIISISAVIGGVYWHIKYNIEQDISINEEYIPVENNEEINTEYALITEDNKKVILNEDIKLFDKEVISEEEGRGDGFHWKDYVYDDIEIHALIGDDGIERCNRIITTSQNYKTPREIKVGDSLEELIKLYPEASKDPWNNIYIYDPADEIGFNRIFFTLENDIIKEIKLENGIDG